jgi:hypothetical protein
MNGTDRGLTPRPEDLTVTRLARLTLLLAAAPGQPQPKPLDVERLATYDFFADNPLLVFAPGTPERTSALLAGFEPQSLSYSSASQRFTNRRARLQNDLALLLARGLVRAKTEGKRVVYELTDTGHTLAGEFSSVYAQGYRVSARLIARALNRLGSHALRDRTTIMLHAEAFLVDLDLPEQTSI